MPRLTVLLLVLAACGPSGTPASPPEAADPETALPEAEPPAPASVPLTADGWGPLRIGMTRAEVVAALGEDADPNAAGGPDPAACDEFRPERAPAGVLVMVEDGVLTRVSLVDGAEIVTPEGLGIGDDAVAVVAAYGGAVDATPHEYLDPPAEYLTVWRAGDGGAGSRGLRYETDGEGRVTAVRGGGPSIQYVEGCA